MECVRIYKALSPCVIEPHEIPVIAQCVVKETDSNQITCSKSQLVSKSKFYALSTLAAPLTCGPYNIQMVGTYDVPTQESLETGPHSQKAVYVIQTRSRDRGYGPGPPGPVTATRSPTEQGRRSGPAQTFLGASLSGGRVAAGTSVRRGRAAPSAEPATPGLQTGAGFRASCLRPSRCRCWGSSGSGPCREGGRRLLQLGREETGPTWPLPASAPSPPPAARLGSERRCQTRRASTSSVGAGGQGDRGDAGARPLRQE